MKFFRLAKKILFGFFFTVGILTTSVMTIGLYSLSEDTGEDERVLPEMVNTRVSRCVSGMVMVNNEAGTWVLTTIHMGGFIAAECPSRDSFPTLSSEEYATKTLQIGEVTLIRTAPTLAWILAKNKKDLPKVKQTQRIST